MATVVVAALTSVPLVLLLWDLGRNRDRAGDRHAGHARLPIA